MGKLLRNTPSTRFEKMLKLLKRIFCLHLNWMPYYAWHPSRIFGMHVYECKHCGKVKGFAPGEPPNQLEKQMKIIETIFLLLIVSVLALFLYGLVFWGPYNLYAESQCLAKGYSEHRVSIGLEIYCMSLDGSLTVRVDKL